MVAAIALAKEGLYICFRSDIRRLVSRSIKSRSSASVAWNPGSSASRQRKKTKLEMLLGWKVVEWNVDFAEVFQ